MTEQTLFDVPSTSVPDETARLLDLIAGDPLHAKDRRAIVHAIVAEANAHGGAVDPNRVRARLADEKGQLTVYPRVIGATYQALTTRGVLRSDGWTISTDRVGRNAGRPARKYRMRPGAVAA